MEAADLILATGGSGMVKAAYSSGTPAYGVGPGNPPVILDRGYDLKDAAEKTVTAVGSDNGILCDGDNQLFYPAEVEKEFFEELKKAGVVLFEDEKTIENFGKALFVNGKANPKLVGKDAPVIAKEAGVEIPADTKVVALHYNGVGKTNILNKEIMGPIVILKAYDKFEDAVAMAVQNMEESGGIGHTAGLFSHDMDHVRYAAERIPVARVLVNQPSPDAWGPKTNGLSPAVSESCGTWGNNIQTGNVDYIHMLNVRVLVNQPSPDAWGPKTNGLSPAVSESCGTWGNNIQTGNVDYIHMLNVAKIALPLDVALPNGEELFAD